MSPLKYYNQISLNLNTRSLRYQLIRYAQTHGIKPAARLFHTTPRTVRKWLRRFEDGSLDALVDNRSIARSRLSKIPADQRKKAIALKKKHPTWGALRLKHTFSLKISDKAIRKIWKEENLM